MPLSGKKMMKKYEKAGWMKMRQKGSHASMKKRHGIVVIPVHTRDLGKGLEIVLRKKLEEKT